MATDLAQILTAGTGAVAAGAAAVAAFISRATVERADYAFVWAEVTQDQPGPDAQTQRLRVQLHSDGPGIALDVRWSLGGPWEPGRSAYRRAQEEVAARATPAIRALSPGVSRPWVSVADARDGSELDALYGPTQCYVPDDDAWWVLVRWSDSAGRRWEFSEGSAGRELALSPRRCGADP